MPIARNKEQRELTKGLVALLKQARGLNNPEELAAIRAKIVDLATEKLPVALKDILYDVRNRDVANYQGRQHDSADFVTAVLDNAVEPVISLEGGNSASCDLALLSNFDPNNPLGSGHVASIKEGEDHFAVNINRAETIGRNNKEIEFAEVIIDGVEYTPTAFICGGGVDDGHYTSYVKLPDRPDRNWRGYNDHRVTGDEGGITDFTYEEVLGGREGNMDIITHEGQGHNVPIKEIFKPARTEATLVRYSRSNFILPEPQKSGTKNIGKNDCWANSAMPILLGYLPQLQRRELKDDLVAKLFGDGSEITDEANAEAEIAAEDSVKIGEDELIKAKKAIDYDAIRRVFVLNAFKEKLIAAIKYEDVSSEGDVLLKGIKDALLKGIKDALLKKTNDALLQKLTDGKAIDEIQTLGGLLGENAATDKERKKTLKALAPELKKALGVSAVANAKDVANWLDNFDLENLDGNAQILAQVAEAIAGNDATKTADLVDLLNEKKVESDKSKTPPPTPPLKKPTPPIIPLFLLEKLTPPPPNPNPTPPLKVSPLSETEIVRLAKNAGILKRKSNSPFDRIVKRQKLDNNEFSLTVFNPRTGALHNTREAILGKFTNHNKVKLEEKLGNPEDFTKALNESKIANGRNFKQPKAYVGIGANVNRKEMVVNQSNKENVIVTMTLGDIFSDGFADKELGLERGDKIQVSGLVGKNDEELKKAAMRKIRNLEFDKVQFSKDIGKTYQNLELKEEQKKNPNIYLWDKKEKKYEPVKFQEFSAAMPKTVDREVL